MSGLALDNWYEIDIYETLSCINAIEIAKLSGKVSPIILNHMIPRRAGHKSIYRKNNSTLEMATANYIPFIVKYNIFMSHTEKLIIGTIG